MVSRFGGVSFLVTSLVGMVAGLFILGRLAGMVDDPRNRDALTRDDLPGLLVWLLDHRLALIGIALPGLLGGLMLLIGRPPRGLWYLLGLGGVLGLFALILFSVFQFIAPLYQYQEL